jgi:hypothetical protein
MFLFCTILGTDCQAKLTVPHLRFAPLGWGSELIQTPEGSARR